MHNFSVPSTLKLWIDQVVRAGRTFSYGEAGPVGLLKGKKITFLVASGGVYSKRTPVASYDLVEPYLRALFGFLGITDLDFVVAGGVSAVMSAKLIGRPSSSRSTKPSIRVSKPPLNPLIAARPS